MKITGQVTGSFLVGASAGAMFLPWLIGQFFESTSARTLPVVVIVSLSLALLLFSTTKRQAIIVNSNDREDL